MKSLILFFTFIIPFALVARPSPLEKVQPAIVGFLNHQFDISVTEMVDFIEECPTCGDVVGNGHGGDVVGNGGGIIETKMHFYINSMEMILANVLKQVTNSHSEGTVEAIGRILKMLKSKSGKTELIFISGEVTKRFFKEENDLEIRVAKTGFTSNYPIYLNVDLLYQNSKNTDASLLGILVHELGHQAGYRSHSALDQVAAVVEYYYKNNQDQLSEILVSEQKLNVSYLNFDSIVADSRLYVEYGFEVAYVERFDYLELKKFCGYRIPGGYRYLNLHWKNFDTKTYEKQPQHQKYSNEILGTLEIKCLQAQAQIHLEYVPVKIDLNIIDGKIKISQELID